MQLACDLTMQDIMCVVEKFKTVSLYANQISLSFFNLLK